MKVLVIGSGGREHALVWKLAGSPRVKKIYCAPGNGGIASLAECIPLAIDNIADLVFFAKKENIDLTLVGPELPLSLGIVDTFQKEGLKIFGPNQKASIIEASKCFTKEFCTRYDIPTAPYEIFNDPTRAKIYLVQKNQFPIVIKADGLASGKGVIIARSLRDGEKAIDQIMLSQEFGEAGKSIVIEEFLVGEEATFMVITDGENFIPFESAQDHKAIGEGDTGPNTGGMGAYSPAPLIKPEITEKIIQRVIQPTLEGLKREGRPYQGILYAGLMIDKEGNPHVVEYNCRFGDPEAQVILFRLKSDLVLLIEACLNGTLKNFKLEFYPESSVCVVMSAEGYPGTFEKGKIIEGLEKIKDSPDVFVFHAGTKIADKRLLTSGGRVLGITVKALTLKQALDKVYQNVSKISWDGAYYRKDIGRKGLR